MDRVEVGPVAQLDDAAQAAGLKLEVVKLAEAKRGFVLLPRRWVVERSFGWAARFRRLATGEISRMIGASKTSIVTKPPRISFTAWPTPAVRFFSASKAARFSGA